MGKGQTGCSTQILKMSKKEKRDARKGREESRKQKAKILAERAKPGLLQMQPQIVAARKAKEEGSRLLHDDEVPWDQN